MVIWQFSPLRPILSSLIIYFAQIHYKNDRFATPLHTRKDNSTECGSQDRATKCYPGTDEHDRACMSNLNFPITL